MSETALHWIAAISILTGGGTGWWMASASGRLSPRLVRLETARNPADILKILNSWGVAGRKTAKRVLGADFALLVAYGSGTASLVRLAADRTPDWWISRMATPVAVIAIATALADAVENIGAWRMINQHFGRWPAITSFATAGKLLGLAIVAVWGLTWIMWGELLLLARAARSGLNPAVAWNWWADLLLAL